MFSYDLKAAFTRGIFIHYKLAEIELEMACHRTDHVLEGLYLKEVVDVQ